MNLPTDDEIRAVAEELGLLDADGQVPRDKRTQLAAVAMRMRDVPDDGDGPQPLTTAQALSRFHDELVAEEFRSSDLLAAILCAVAPALIARDGLILKNVETTRTYAWPGVLVRETENRT